MKLSHYHSIIPSQNRTHHLNDRSALKGSLQAAIIRRSHWIDLRVLDSTGKVVAIEPAGAGRLFWIFWYCVGCG